MRISCSMTMGGPKPDLAGLTGGTLTRRPEGLRCCGIRLFGVFFVSPARCPLPELDFALGLRRGSTLPQEEGEIINLLTGEIIAGGGLAQIRPAFCAPVIDQPGLAHECLEPLGFAYRGVLRKP